jgi:peptidyl-prolyl cis-trans isomerase B (cyclophilin B)
MSISTKLKMFFVLAFTFIAAPIQAADIVIVLLTTTKGDIKLELDREKAPITVDNFVKYVNDGYYEGVIFHRIMADFMIQAGGFTDQSSAAVNKAKDGQRANIKNESSNGLSNENYTIAMARQPGPDTASSQFFINTKDNAKILDKNAPGRDGVGYCVFGKVIEGKDVVDAIKAVPVSRDPRSGEPSLPKEIVKIEKARVIDAAKKEAADEVKK